MFRTIRFRIALWNAIAVAIVTLLALFGVREGVRWTMLLEIDQNLEEDASEILLALEELQPTDFGELTDELRRKAIGHREHEWFVALGRKNHETIWSSGTIPSNIFEDSFLQSYKPRTVEGQRILLTLPPTNRHEIQSVWVGASLDRMNQDLDQIDRLVLFSASSILFVAPFLGYFLAGRATRDVRFMAATAERLRPSHLDERLPIRGSGDEFDRLAQNFNNLLDRIASYIGQKKNFLANSAHELRTPLAAIRSSIEVALIKDRNPKEYTDLLEDLIEESEILEKLVNQILLISESESSDVQAHREKVCLSDILTKSYNMFLGVAESLSVNIVLDVEPEVFVTGNRTHLRQLVNNLIDNAIKYSGSKATISIRLHANEGFHMATFTITDNGPGIEESELPFIFERFYRVDKSRQRNETTGSGLGLSICKTIVESHGGIIEFQSKIQEGTTVTVSIPIDLDS